MAMLTRILYKKQTTFHDLIKIRSNYLTGYIKKKIRSLSKLQPTVSIWTWLHNCLGGDYHMYPWDLQILEKDGVISFSATSDTDSSIVIDDDDIGAGINRIINLIITDCPGAVIYVSDFSGNIDLIESIMQKRKVAYVID